MSSTGSLRRTAALVLTTLGGLAAYAYFYFRIDALDRGPLRPVVVERAWGPGDPAVQYPKAVPRALLSVIVRDALEPQHGVSGARAQLVPRFTTEGMLAGAIATTASTATSPPDGYGTGLAEPPLWHPEGGAFLVRVEASGYLPTEVLVDVTAGCAPTLEVYLQRGYRGGGDPPPPRATLTTCRGPRPA